MAANDHPARLRVLVYGYYGCGNIGDELLLNAAMTGILRHWPEATFRVRNLGPVEVEPALADRVELTQMDRILVAPDRGRLRRVLAYLGAAWRVMRGCQVLVLGGGTLISGAAMSALILLAMVVVLARLRGLAVLGIGLGVARLERWPARLLARLIVALSKDFAVRDRASHEALGAPPGVRLTGDLVYAWWPGTADDRARAGGDVIVVSLWSIAPAGEDRLMEEIAAALVAAAKAGARIRFVVFQDMDAATGALSDRGAIARMREKLSAASVASDVVRPQATRASLAEAFEGARLHIGARFHAGVVATLLRVPTVGIALDPKIASLGETLGLPVLVPQSLSRTEIESAIAAATAHRLRADRLAELRALSAGNFDWFARQAPPVARVHAVAEASRQ